MAMTSGGTLPRVAGRWLRPWAFPALLLGALEFYARTAGRGSEALAAPSAAAAAFAQLLPSMEPDGLFRATAFTLGSAAAGLLLGTLAGVAIGLPLGLSRRAAQAGFLTIEVLRPIPSVALIPLAMLVFGFGFRMEIGVVAFAVFWPMLILSQAAVRQVEPRLLEVARALELAPAARIRKIVLPAALPRLFVALRLSVAVALVVAVTVEIAANPHGMGYALIIAQQSLDPALMLAWLGWIGAVGVAVNAVAQWAQRAAARAMGEVRR